MQFTNSTKVGDDNVPMIACTALAVVLCLSAHASAQQAGLYGSIADSDKPVQALVSLEQLRDESCRELYSGKSETTSDKAKKSDKEKKATECRGTVQNSEITGKYEFSGLQAGWYVLRFQWVMSQPPDSKKAIGCFIDGWSISYVPWKASGIYKGFAQSPPFEIQDGESKSMDFNYDAKFKIQKDCARPLKWQKR
jgi:hypothetical protein